MLITGTRKGIGNYLAHYYSQCGFQIIGCSRSQFDTNLKNYRHYCLDITDEQAVKQMFAEIRQTYQRLDVLINNAAIMATNHALLTPLKTVEAILRTNVAGTFLFCQESAKIMQKKNLAESSISDQSVTVLKLPGKLFTPLPNQP